MGRSRAEKAKLRSQTLPSSPSRSSSSSSDFEFTICSSPRNNTSATADDLFYKGKLLPLHLSPRLSMVRTLLLASSTNSSSSDTTSASRDSSGSSSSSDAVMFADYNCDSSRPSSVADLEDEFLKRPLNAEPMISRQSQDHKTKSTNKYFSLAKISSVFKKEPRTTASSAEQPIVNASSGKKGMSASARDVLKKYIKKVKPLYEKLSHTQKQIKIDGTTCLVNPSDPKSDTPSNKRSIVKDEDETGGTTRHSFSGNLWFPNKKKGVVSSCPSSMRSSPCHSGVLTRNGLPHPLRTCSANGGGGGDSSMEELHSAIQGAIAHCKNSMLQSRIEPN